MNDANESDGDSSDSDNENGNNLHMGGQTINNYEHSIANSENASTSRTKRKRAPWTAPSKAVKWTHEMVRMKLDKLESFLMFSRQDERLREAFALFPKDWVKTAIHVGFNVKKDQCRHRWSLYVDPATAVLKRGPWTKEEVCGGGMVTFADT